MSTTYLEQLPTDALTQVFHRLSPSSRLMLRQTCHWACRIIDETCFRLGGVAETDIRSNVASTLNNNDYGSRFCNVQYLHMHLSDTCDRYQNGAPAAELVNKDSRPSWPVLLSQLRFLCGINLTSCKWLTQDEIQQIAAGCPALVILHVHRDTVYNSADVTLKLSDPGQSFSDAAHPDRRSRGGDALMRRPTASEPWALLGLTFAPLAACTKVRELKLYDAPSPLANSFDGPTGFPAGALLSLGCLTQLQSLALAGVMAGLDLCHCLYRLTGLTRLELALLPTCCENGSARWRRPRQQQPKVTPSLGHLKALRSLRLRLVATAGDVLAPTAAAAVAAAADETTLPRELYNMVLSANLSTLEVLHLDLPPPPPPAATSGGGASRPVSRLSPLTLACSPEHLEALMAGGLSLRKLQALQLRGWVPWDLSDRCQRPMGRLSHGQGVVPGVLLQPRVPAPYSHHLSEILVRWALCRVAMSMSMNGLESGGGSGGGDHGDDGDLLPRDVRQQFAAGRLPLGRAVRHAAWNSPAAAQPARLPAGLRLRVSIFEGEPAALIPGHEETAAVAAAIASRQACRSKCYTYIQSAASHVDLDLVLPPPTGPPNHRATDRRVAVDRAAFNIFREDFGPDEEPQPQPHPQGYDTEAADDGFSFNFGFSALATGTTARPDPRLLASAMRAAAGSRLAAPLRWLPYQLPNLYGLSLSYNAVDERAVALLAAGLPALRRLALGRVELKAVGGGGLVPLASLQHLSELRFGNISFIQETQQKQQHQQRQQWAQNQHQPPSIPGFLAVAATATTTTTTLGAAAPTNGTSIGAQGVPCASGSGFGSGGGYSGGGGGAAAARTTSPKSGTDALTTGIATATATSATATATSATVTADSDTGVAAILSELEDCCLAFSLPAALLRRRFWSPSSSSSLASAAAPAGRGEDAGGGSAAMAAKAGASSSSTTRMTMATDKEVAEKALQGRAAEVVVVVVPPAGISLDQAVQVNRRLEAVVITAAAAAAGSNGNAAGGVGVRSNDDVSGCFKGVLWATCRAQLSLRERGLKSAVDVFPEVYGSGDGGGDGGGDGDRRRGGGRM